MRNTTSQLNQHYYKKNRRQRNKNYLISMKLNSFTHFIFLLYLLILLLSVIYSAPVNLLHSPILKLNRNEIPIASQIITSSSVPLKGWQCHCLNYTHEFEEESECVCEGQSLIRIPQKLHQNTQRLIIQSAGLRMLKQNGLKPYSNFLKDITLKNLENFESIEPGAFASLQCLRLIYIENAPKLETLSKDVFFNISSTIKTIRIINSGLVNIPDFTYLHLIGTILQMVDLEGNNIEQIHKKGVKIKTEQLILDNNFLKEIADSAFFGSQIAKLSIRENRQLQEIHPSAFFGIMNLQDLDLSKTSIASLPSIGLNELEFLRVQNTHTLKTIPSIYNFKNLQVAWLTHSFHCCAFKFPSRHDPSSHVKQIKYMEDLQKTCIISADNKKINSEKLPQNLKNLFNEYLLNDVKQIRIKRIKRKRWMTDIVTNEGDNYYSHFENGNSEQIENDTIINTSNNDDDDVGIHPIRGSPITIESDDEEVRIKENEENFNEKGNEEDQGLFHDSTDDVVRNNLLEAVCGNLTPQNIDIKCYPIPDELNPCEDVMGSKWLRISVWIVVLLAVFGNFAVLIVNLATSTDGSVQKFLMSHLALADLCMGVYLLFIAAIDAHSMSEYFNYAFDWQYGAGCKIAGFLTVFASHLSVYTLTIITLERWFAITNAMYLNKRIKLKPARFIMIGGWIYSFIMATFPLFGISNYSSTSICLPMEARDSYDVVYLISILGINGVAFFVIAICYGKIYYSLGTETRHARSSSTGEMTVAKKMALLVFTNFSCWAPIAFFGLTALAGYPLINVTNSKILLVFFYPLNSCADPYLYAILTAQYRRDLYTLLSKFGFCKRKSMQYKASISVPFTNFSQNRSARASFNTSAIPISKCEQPPEAELMISNNVDYV